MLLSVSALAVDRFVTSGRRTAQFCFGLLMRCLFFWAPPLCPLVRKIQTQVGSKILST